MDVVDTFFDKRVDGLPLCFYWGGANRGQAMRLDGLHFSEIPDTMVDVKIIIGATEFERIEIAPAAFRGLAFEKVKLHLVFEERCGRKVRFPKDCRNLFAGSTSIYDIDFSGVDTSQVGAMQGMFYGCTNISELDLRAFDTENTFDTRVRRMCSGCKNLRKLNISSFAEEQKERLNDYGETFSINESEQMARLCQIITDDTSAKDRGASGALNNTEFVPLSSWLEIVRSMPRKVLKFVSERTLKKPGNSTSPKFKEQGTIFRNKGERTVTQAKPIANVELDEPVSEIRKGTKILNPASQMGAHIQKEKAKPKAIEVRKIKQEQRWNIPVVKFFGWAKRKVLSWFGH